MMSGIKSKAVLNEARIFSKALRNEVAYTALETPKIFRALSAFCMLLWTS